MSTFTFVLHLVPFSTLSLLFQRSQFGAVEGDLALAMSLYHGFDLLQQHGLRSLYNYLDSILSGDKASARTKNELLKNANFKEIIDTLTAKFQPVKSVIEYTLIHLNQEKSRF